MTIKNSSLLIAGLFGLAAMTTASADNTVLTTYGSAKKGGQVMNLDLQSNGSASSFQFAVNMPKGVKASNIASCVSNLPKSHVGKCKANKDGSKLAVVVYSLDNTLLPAGMIEVGTIALSGSSAAKGAVSVSNVVFAGPNKGNLGKGSSEVVDLDRASTSQK